MPIILIFGHEDVERRLTFPDDENDPAGTGVKDLAVDIAQALTASYLFGAVKVVRPAIEVLYDNYQEGLSADSGNPDYDVPPLEPEIVYDDDADVE